VFKHYNLDLSRINGTRRSLSDTIIILNIITFTYFTFFLTQRQSYIHTDHHHYAWLFTTLFPFYSPLSIKSWQQPDRDLKFQILSLSLISTHFLPLPALNTEHTVTRQENHTHQYYHCNGTTLQFPLLLPSSQNRFGILEKGKPGSDIAFIIDDTTVLFST
jgi:hypothetical protein